MLYRYDGYTRAKIGAVESKNDNTLSRISSPLLSDVAYQAIRGGILSGKLDASRWLRQECLARQLGVSQATVREALNRLVLEGLATRVPYKGVKPIHISEEDLRDLYDMRALLEGFANEIAASTISAQELSGMRRLLPRTMERVDKRSSEAARRANRAFHLIAIKATRRKHLERVLGQLWILIDPYMRMAYGRSWTTGRSPEERAKKIQVDYQDHVDLLEALERNDGNGAREALIKHVFREYHDLEELISG